MLLKSEPPASFYFEITYHPKTINGCVGKIADEIRDRRRPVIRYHDIVNTLALHDVQNDLLKLLAVRTYEHRLLLEIHIDTETCQSLSEMELAEAGVLPILTWPLYDICTLWWNMAP